MATVPKNRMGWREVDLGSIAPGINNRLKAERLQAGEGQRFVQGAENVDIDQTGRHPSRRPGMALRNGGNAHSLWADERGAFAVLNNALVQLTDLGADAFLGTTLVQANMAPYPVSYSRGADNDVYLSNGMMIGRVTADGELRPIATPAPNQPPGITVGAAGSGGLFAGLYLITATRVSVDGESPAAEVQQVQVPENGSLTLTSAETLSYYMSGPDGDILTLQLENAPPGATLLVGHNEAGRVCRTLHRAVMPAGEIVRHHNGRMLVAQGNTLLASDPYNYGIVDPRASFFPLSDAITMLEPCGDALFIGTEALTYRIVGDLFSAKLDDALPYGALRGTGGTNPKNETVFWQSQRGLCIGDGTGAVRNVQEQALMFGAASSGASQFRERDGMTHILASRNGAQPSVSQASSFMEARIVRKGTTL